MKKRGRVGVTLLMMVVGALVGSALWSMLSGVLPAALTRAVTIGTTGAPFTLDFSFIVLTFGLVLSLNIGGILGIAVALLVAAKI